MHSLETKRTHFPFKHFPFYPLHSGVCRLIPLFMFASFGSTFFRAATVLVSPFPPPAFSLTPSCAPLVRVLPSWSRIYASFFMHLTRYMIHVFSLSLSPPPPSSPNIVSLVLVWILLRPFCLLFPDFVVGTGESSKSRVGLSLRVCYVCVMYVWG